MFSTKKDLNKISSFLDEFEKYITNDTNSLIDVEKIDNNKLKNIEEKLLKISDTVREKD